MTPSVGRCLGARRGLLDVRLALGMVVGVALTEDRSSRHVTAWLAYAVELAPTGKRFARASAVALSAWNLSTC